MKLVYSQARGLSMMELILATALLGLMSVFGLLSLKHGRGSSQTQSLAQEIAEEFKSARELAIARQMPVALVFPSNTGSTGMSASFYQLEGVSSPRVTRSFNYSSSFPEACFFWGIWGSGESDRQGPAPIGLDFDPSLWLPLPEPTDYALIFSPSGVPSSNGLPVFDGEYRLLVSQGAEEGGVAWSEANGLSLFSLTSMAKPFTVRISQTGAVTVSPGLVGGSGVTQRDALPVDNLASHMPQRQQSTSPPEIVSLRTEPTPSYQAEEGTVTFVPVEGYITLVAEATHASGDELSVRWSGDGGSFSSQNPTPMSWDSKLQRWVSRWTWTPPADAIPSETFNLVCHVRDSEGREVSQQLGAGISIYMVAADRLAIISSDDWWEHFYVSWMNPRGTNVIDVTVPMKAWEQLTPVWAPNGTKLAFYSGDFADQANSNDWWGTFEATLFIVNYDGTHLRPLFECRGDITDYMFGPSFSPSGAHVAFSAYLDDNLMNSRVRAVEVFGNPNPVRVTDESGNPDAGSVEHTEVSWHPSKNLILYTSTNRNTGESAIRVTRFPTTLPVSKPADDWPIVSTGPGPFHNTVSGGHWSHDGRRIVYTQGGRLFVHRVDANARPVGAPIDLTPPGAFDAVYPRFSPRGNRISVVDWNTDNLWVVRPNDLDSDTDNEYLQVTTIGDIYGYNWSPDGRRFVFATYDSQLFVVSSGGGSALEITPENFNVYTTPAWWSPTGWVAE